MVDPWLRVYAPPAGPAGPPGPPPRPELRFWLLMLALAAQTAAVAVQLAALLVRHADRLPLLARLDVQAERWGGLLRAAAAADRAIGGLSFAVVGLFLAWQLGAVRALAGGPLRARDVLVAWLVPGVNLVAPLRLMRRLRALGRGAPVEARPPGWFYAWWWLFVALTAWGAAATALRGLDMKILMGPGLSAGLRALVLADHLLFAAAVASVHAALRGTAARGGGSEP